MVEKTRSEGKGQDKVFSRISTIHSLGKGRGVAVRDVVVRGVADEKA